MNFILNTILEFCAAHKLLVAIILCVLGLAIIFGYLTHERDKALKEKRAAEIEANRQKQKADGLRIIINSNTQAQEIQKEKEKADVQAINTNNAFNNFNSSVSRDSNSFTGNFSEARRRFCRNFPLDSACR